ncbi:LacI family DNA-binding transcriptional regulator [Streptomyces sp. NPDC004539]|uniref:LacI family DNA-binding transcriptional regulator n=1 Tax=Streptomyces sp. NPDC004539 TaxID=3154280 RepID=UPI0033B1D0AA
MAGRTGRVTATDVAKEAGVSQATVSYVLNDAAGQKISDQTRERVLAAVARLGYKPSAAARALRLGRSDLVLMFLPGVPIGDTLTALVERLGEALEPHGLTLVTRRERHSPLKALWGELTPAVVIMTYGAPDEEAARMRSAGIDVVTIALEAPEHGECLVIPQRRIGAMQVRRLVETGHRHIGYAAPGDPRVRDFFELRLAGAREECAASGLEPPVVYDVPLSVPAAAEAARRWHTALPAVTGVCAYNDQTAFALLAGARRVGLTAPGDLAVVGVDNDKLAPFATPPLTTVDNNMDAVVGWFVKVIVGRLDGRRPAELPETVPVTLVVRESA